MLMYRLDHIGAKLLQKDTYDLLWRLGMLTISFLTKDPGMPLAK